MNSRTHRATLCFHICSGKRSTVKEEFSRCFPGDPFIWRSVIRKRESKQRPGMSVGYLAVRVQTELWAEVWVRARSKNSLGTASMFTMPPTDIPPTGMFLKATWMNLDLQNQNFTWVGFNWFCLKSVQINSELQMRSENITQIIGWIIWRLTELSGFPPLISHQALLAPHQAKLCLFIYYTLGWTCI